MAKESNAFGTQRPKKAHLMRGSGGLSAEISDLRADVEEGFQNAEDKTGLPEADFIDGTMPAAAGGDFIVAGRNLLQAQTFDTLQLTEGAADLTVDALTPGDSEINVVMTVGLAGLVITYADKLLTIELAAAGSTDDAIATAINADAADTDGHIRATSAAGGSFTVAQDSQAMAGGVGDYADNKVMCAGIECLPANLAGTTSVAKWTDTGVTVTAPALAPAAVGDAAQVAVISYGRKSNALTAILG